MKSINAIAQVCHEMNRLYCSALGDDSQKPWQISPKWQQDSAVEGVKLHIDSANIGPSTSHDAWLKHKKDTGWIYGEIKDAEAKTHPCMVSFAELPRSQQSKDLIFAAVVRGLKP